MEELLKGPQDDKLSRIIPEETRILDLRVENGIAYLDLSSEIATANYGSQTEESCSPSIVWTLTQLERSRPCRFWSKVSCRFHRRALLGKHTAYALKSS